MSSKHVKVRTSRAHSPIFCLKSNSQSRTSSHHRSLSRCLPKSRPTSRPRSSADEFVASRGSQIISSPDILAFYKDKIKQCNKSNEDMQERVAKCKQLCDSSFEIEQELLRRNAEVSSLQQAVSDLQVYLYQEREQVLRLYSENDKLKIRELEDRKKIDLLLTLSGATEDELTYFLCDSETNVSVPQKLPPRLKRMREKLNVAHGIVGDHSNNKSKGHRSPSRAINSDILTLQNQSLAAQLEEQTHLYKDQTESLLKDREITQKEREVERNRFQAEIASLSSQLKETKDELCSVTEDFLKMQLCHRDEAVAWAGEKDRITRNLETCQEQIGQLYQPVDGYAVSGCGSSARLNRQKSQCDITMLKEELRQREDLVNIYQEQCVALEIEMNNLRNQTDAARNKFKDRTQKLAAQVTFLKNKYDDLDHRRILEAEGFRNDIKLLRNRLQQLEKKITRSMLKGSQVSLASEKDHLRLYSTATDTMSKACQLEKELRNIQSKVLDIEDEMMGTSI